MLRFEKKREEILADKETKITSRSGYEAMAKESVVDITPSTAESVAALKENIKIFKDIIQEIDPNYHFSPEIKPYLGKIKYQELDTIVIERRVVDCIIRNGNKSLVNKIISTGDFPVDPNAIEDDIYWKIAYWNARNKHPFIYTIFVAIVQMLLMMINNMVKSFADAIGQVRARFMILFFGICIDIGIVFKALILRFIHYYLYWIIYLCEDIEWACIIKYQHSKNKQWRRSNVYRDSFGSIIEKAFHPYFNHPNAKITDGNREYYNAMREVSSVMNNVFSYIVKVSFFKIRCNEINFNAHIRENQPAQMLQSIADIAKRNPTYESLVEKCNECAGNCDDVGLEIEDNYDGKYNEAMSNLSEVLNNYRVENPVTPAHIVEQLDLCDNFLNEAKDFLDDNGDTLGGFATVSTSLIPSSAMQKFNSAMNKMEMGMREIDRIFGELQNFDIVDLAELAVGKKELSFDKAKVTKEVLQKDKTIMLNKKDALTSKIAEIETYLGKVKGDLDKYNSDFMKNPNKATSNNVKITTGEMERHTKSLDTYKRELARVEKDIAKIEKNMKTASSTVKKVSDKPALKNAEAVEAAILFAFDMICCVLSLLLMMTSKMMDKDPKKFKEIVDSFWYQLLTGKEDYKNTHIYTAVEMSIETVQYIIDVLVGSQFALGNKTKASASARFAIDFDILRIAQSMAMNSIFIVVDGTIRYLDSLIFSQLAILHRGPKWIQVTDSTSIEEYKGIAFRTVYKSKGDIENLQNPRIGQLECLGVPEGTGGSFLHPGLSKYVQVFIYKEDDTSTMLDDFLAMLFSGKCVSLNFLFDYLMSYVTKFHDQMILMKIFLEYEPKFDIYADFEFDSRMQFSSNQTFKKMLDLILKYFSLFMKICNLENQVDLNEALKQIIESEMKKEGVISQKKMYESRYEQYESSVAGDPYSDEFDIDRYLNLVMKEDRLTTNIEQKIEDGTLSPQAMAAVDYLKRYYAAPKETDNFRSLIQDNSKPDDL